MDDNTELGMIEFNKSQTGKIMKFNITNIVANNIRLYIAKDFGFKGYYPMINKSNWETKNIGSEKPFYIETLYNLEYELYEEEGEGFYIYIFDSEKNNLPILDSKTYIISEPVYIENLLTQKNKYNFEVIQPNSTGSIILNIKGNVIQHQFYICKSKEITFKIEGGAKYYDYPINNFSKINPFI